MNHVYKIKAKAKFTARSGGKTSYNSEKLCCYVVAESYEKAIAKLKDEQPSNLKSMEILSFKRTATGVIT